MTQDKRPCTIRELAGMPVMTRETGRKLGNVKDIIFDPPAGRLAAVTIESAGFFGPRRRFLKMDDIRSIGEDAIMVDSDAVLRRPENEPNLRNTVDRGNTLTAKTIVTEDGNILGNVSDVHISPDSGEALRYEVSGGAVSDAQTGRSTFPVPNALVVGPDAIVVPDSVEQQMEAQAPGGLAGAYAGTKEGAADYWSRVKEWWHGVTQSAVDKEADYALGKVAGADVMDDQGNPIVRGGEEITEREVVRARVSGKVHQLALAAGWGVTRSGYESARERASAATQERAAAFVVGKKANETIRDDDGNVIVRKNAVIDQEDVDQARAAGKLSALTASVTAAGAKGVLGAIGDKTQSALQSGRGYVSGAAEQMGQNRLTAQQREIAVGKVSATDIRDDEGNVLVAEGEVFTPMALQALEDQGRLGQIRLMPVMGPERTAGQVSEVPRIELLVRAEDAHSHRD